MRPGHLGLHSLCESTRSLERAGNDEDACEEKPQMSMARRERVGAVFAVVLRDDLDDGKDKRDQWVLEDLGPCTLVFG
jgi:hypothetical protein